MDIIRQADLTTPALPAPGSFMISLWPTDTGGRVNAFLYNEDGWGFPPSVVAKSGLLQESWDGNSSLKLTLDREGFHRWKEFVESHGGVLGSGMCLRPGDPIPPGEWHVRDIAGGWPEGCDRQLTGIKGLIQQQGHVPQPEIPRSEKKRRKVPTLPGKSDWLPKTCCFLYHSEASKSEYRVLELVLKLSSGGTNYFYGSIPNMAILLGLSEKTVWNCLQHLRKKGFLKLPPDVKDQKSEFGSVQYIVVDHDQYVKDRGDAFCLRGQSGAKGRAIKAGKWRDE
jgi:hypothetical protein